MSLQFDDIGTTSDMDSFTFGHHRDGWVVHKTKHMKIRLVLLEKSQQEPRTYE